MIPTKNIPFVSIFLIAAFLSASSTRTAFAQSTLLHYWSFNTNINAKQTIPAPPIRANFSYLDTNKAVIQYDTIPGTPKPTGVAPGTYVDSLNGTAGLASKTNGAYDNTTAGDTLNARLGFPAGNSTSSGGLRVRNPSWSSELRIYMPTTLYNNPVVKYALQSSSTTSGQHYQVFAYSTDSGTTWKTSSLTVNGVSTDTLDCTQSQYQSATSFGLVTIGFGGDTNVNNNPRLVLRIRWSGQASTFSGNNRFDNLSVEAGPVPRSIALHNLSVSDTLISGQIDTFTFSTTGKISKEKWISYSTDSGQSWTAIGTDTTNRFAWHIPNVPNPVPFAMIRVVDSDQIIGTSPSFVILPVRYFPPEANLIYYWHFNGFSGAYTYPDVPQLRPDYSAIPGAPASMEYERAIGSVGLVENGTGTSGNSQMNYPSGAALELDNPTSTSDLQFYIPAPNRKNITVNFALQTSDGIKGPLVASYDFSLDSGATWQTTGLRHVADSIDAPGYTNGNWGLISVPLLDSLTSDNPKLVFRIRFTGNNSSANGGYVRIDNVTVTGKVGQIVIAGAPTLLHYWSFNNLLAAYHNPGIPSLPADFSLVDTGHIDYTLEPGTSPDYPGYIDNVAGSTANAQLGAPAGQSLRVRNPSDSMELRVAIPTTGYKNIVIKYALESSSTNSGQLTELFDYSPDGGTTWKTSGLTVQGQNVDTLDVTDSTFQGANWGLVTIGLTDPGTSNNSRLIFRITFAGNTSKTSGNNRFDNFSVIGVPGIAAPVSPVIHYWHFDSLNTASR